MTIQLLDARGAASSPRGRPTADGSYKFDNLPPGTYSVRELQPAGYFDGGDMRPARTAATTRATT